MNGGTPGPWIVIQQAGANDTTKIVFGLEAGKTYQWKVKTVCSQALNVTSPNTAVLTFVTATSARLQPVEDQRFEIELLDLSGKVLRQTWRTKPDFTIEKQGLPEGMLM